MSAYVEQWSVFQAECRSCGWFGEEQFDEQFAHDEREAHDAAHHSSDPS